MVNRIMLLFAALTISFAASAQTLQPVTIGEQPDCVHMERSSLQFPGSRDAQDLFYAKLDSLLAGGSRSVNIWHVGGSHVQAGYFPLEMMAVLDSLTTGLHNSRGFFFPYTIA